MTKFSELHQKVSAAVPATINESNLPEIEITELKNWEQKKAVETKLKSRKASFLHGKWHKAGKRGEFNATDATGLTFNLRFFSSTDYSVKNRIRDSGKTKYRVYAYLQAQGINISIDVGSATGENSASQEKVKMLKEKMQKIAADVFGVHIDEYDFQY